LRDDLVLRLSHSNEHAKGKVKAETNRRRISMSKEKAMTQPGPLDAVSNLTAAINRGDLAAMLKHFEEDAVLVARALAGQRGQIARGKVAIGEAYAGFVSLKPILRREAQEIVEADGVAFHCSRWTLTATSPDGKRLERAGVSSDVLRKQSDGQWLVLIYNPYGTSIEG
jgi:ketosteroid isomerase-like protein